MKLFFQKSEPVVAKPPPPMCACVVQCVWGRVTLGVTPEQGARGQAMFLVSSAKKLKTWPDPHSSLWPKAVGSCGAYARPFAAHIRASQRSRRWCALPSSTAPPRHRAQRVIAQAAIEPPTFLGHLGRQLGGKLGIEHLLEARSRQLREDEHSAGAPCQPTLSAHQVDRLAQSDDDLQSP